METLLIRGHIWKFGDSIDSGNIDGVMGGVDPEFKNKVKPGDILVSGKFFGMGASDEHAPRSLKQAGIAGVVAESISNIFMRTLINIGLPAMECPGIAGAVSEGDEIEVDFVAGRVRNFRSGQTLNGDSLPEFALQILSSGGLISYLKNDGQFK
jgi:3-isopropylmalate/(R)-2-methylmalate dehydratase small subunit